MDLSTNSNTLLTALSSISIGSEPLLTASTISLSVSPWLDGISSSSPALSASTRLFIAPQSDITSPLKPHSSRRTLLRSQLFSHEYVPLILL